LYPDFAAIFIAAMPSSAVIRGVVLKVLKVLKALIALVAETAGEKAAAVMLSGIRQ
jgi:hypothetical protein